ncbi:Enoyl-CoA hydratase 2 peroxisomal [Zea mays]|uniref:Enoyl-CoA hydratase 2 peroxisomal n=1 Tax=Zea mays TaxID=4577 RepID=A0A1D6EUA7_MAIZE|nr:Enoyl-CoA hydratase 2 peroxisomal [Zea mays]
MGLDLLMCLALSKSYIKQQFLRFTLSIMCFCCDSCWPLFFISIDVQHSGFVRSNGRHSEYIYCYNNLPYFLFSSFDASLLLHGQQYIEIYRPIPSYASVVNRVKVAGLHDKGKATILELETTTSLKESGEILCMNRSTIYLRGAGGFSDSSRPYSYATYPANQVSRISIPNSAPSAVCDDQTKQSQALLYRLSGDYNPLHSDPDIAQLAGFTRPILHGLCTLGFAARAVIKSFCNGEPTAVKSIFGRFLLHVYPGETLSTEMWLDGQKVHYQTKAKERNRAVLSGYVLLQHIPSSL